MDIDQWVHIEHLSEEFQRLLLLTSPRRTLFTNFGSSRSGLPSPTISISPLSTASDIRWLSLQPPVVPITARDYARSQLLSINWSVSGTYQYFLHFLCPFNEVAVMVSDQKPYVRVSQYVVPSSLLLRGSFCQIFHDVASPCRGSVSSTWYIEEIYTGIFEPLDDDTLFREAGTSLDDC